MKNKVNDIIESLHKKFGENLYPSLQENTIILEEVEIKSRGIYFFGEILSQEKNITETQREICKIHHEVFTDLTIACYLCCCSIDNSPRILFRRALELGMATVYLWDLPYKYWNWSTYDDHNNDLNFKEMLDYFNNQGFIDFINRQNSSKIVTLLNKEAINKVYRELSNVIHGKTTYFESNANIRFTYNKENLTQLLNYAIRIENILLSVWSNRFPNILKELEIQFPQITRYKYEY